jgi:uncharacterized membrane protein
LCFINAPKSAPAFGLNQYGFDVALLIRFQVWIAIQAIHYAYPAVTFFYFLLAITVTVCMLQAQALRVQDSKVRRDVMLALIFVVAGTYVRSMPQLLVYLRIPCTDI